MAFEIECNAVNRSALGIEALMVGVDAEELHCFAGEEFIEKREPCLREEFWQVIKYVSCQGETLYLQALDAGIETPDEFLDRPAMRRSLKTGKRKSRIAPIHHAGIDIESVEPFRQALRDSAVELRNHGEKERVGSGTKFEITPLTECARIDPDLLPVTHKERRLTRFSKLVQPFFNDDPAINRKTIPVLRSINQEDDLKQRRRGFSRCAQSKRLNADQSARPAIT